MYPHHELPDYNELKDILLDRMVFEPGRVSVLVQGDLFSAGFIVRLAFTPDFIHDTDFENPMGMGPETSTIMILSDAIHRGELPQWYPALRVEDPAQGFEALAEWYRTTIVKDGRTIIEWFREINNWVMDQHHLKSALQSMPEFAWQAIDARAYGPGRERRLKQFILGYKGVEDAS
jgi:hypothetical protein